MLWKSSSRRRILQHPSIIRKFAAANVSQQCWTPQHIRPASTRAKTQTKTDGPEMIRNLAVVAHIDSGKTTLTESILARSGFLSAPGTVDTASTTTDFLPAERERGITIQSASIPVAWKGWTYNLIDTPGHPDFGMEVESASRVVDGAVVLIDAVEGVEAQTQGVWRQLDRYGVPSRIVFLNKMDRTGASFRASMRSLLNYRLHPTPLAITLPVASFNPRAYATAEPGIQGIVDLVRWELWKWDEYDRTNFETPPFKVIPLPTQAEQLKDGTLFPKDHPLTKELNPARTALLENLSMFSEELMNKLLELPADPSAYLSIEAKSIVSALRSATLRNEVLPVLCGSAMKHIGTDLVLDYAGLLLASPLDIPGSMSLQKSADVQILAWKVAWDRRKKWMTFVRVYSGALTRQTVLFNVNRSQKERVSKLLLLYASQPEEVETLTFGSVGVILGLKHTRTGDTLVSASPHPSSRAKKKEEEETNFDVLRDITPPPAVMSASIIPETNSDLQPVQDALMALSRTDPSARVETLDGQLLVHGLGALHLEIIEGRLRDEWGVAFESGPRRVTYRETFPDSAEQRVNEDWSTELHGRPVSVHMELDIRALAPDEEGDPHWDGNVVLTKTGCPLRAPPTEGSLSSIDAHNPLTHVAQGLASALLTSPFYAFPVSRTRILVRQFGLIPPDISVTVLAGGASWALRRGLMRAGPGPIMEPYTRVTVIVGEDHLGRVVKELTERGGEIVDLGGQMSASSDGEESIPYPEDGVFLPPEWMSPSAFSASKAGRSGFNMKRTIHAITPLSQMLDFNNQLRSLTGGRGSFEMAHVGFRVVSEARASEILTELLSQSQPHRKYKETKSKIRMFDFL